MLAYQLTWLSLRLHWCWWRIDFGNLKNLSQAWQLKRHLTMRIDQFLLQLKKSTIKINWKLVTDASINWKMGWVLLRRWCSCANIPKALHVSFESADACISAMVFNAIIARGYGGNHTLRAKRLIARSSWFCSLPFWPLKANEKQVNVSWWELVDF